MSARGWKVFAVACAVLGLIVGGPIASYDLSQFTRCEASNDFRRDDLARWDYLLALAPPRTNATPAETDLRTKFVTYIKKADKQSHCSLI